jgi:hypothetical protein
MELKELAKIGASQRLKEIDNERKILMDFLESIKAKPARAKFTTAQRREISKRMKKYWADKRKNG